MAFTGILCCMSAAGPIHRGKLSDLDLRFTVVAQSVDCRTKEERDPNSEKYIPKSRYSPLNHYISSHEFVKDKHMDTHPIRYNEEHKKFLMDNGIDDRLATHFARVFVRDPCPTYEGEFIED